jgi:hypothetical protein
MQCISKWSKMGTRYLNITLEYGAAGLAFKACRVSLGSAYLKLEPQGC